jgi:hypothetical protein
MLLLVSAIKLVAEIALLAFAGQFVLGLLAGAKRDDNFFYRLFDVLTKPVVRVTRAITPRVVLDRHVPLAAFVALLSVWLIATIAKVNVCLEIGVELCK